MKLNQEFTLIVFYRQTDIRKRMTVYFGKILQLFGRLIDERLNLRKLHNTNAERDVIDILLNLSEEIDRTHIERMCLVRTFILVPVTYYSYLLILQFIIYNI